MSSGGGSMGQGLAGARPPGMSLQGQHNMPPQGPPLAMNLMNAGSSGALSNDYSHQLVNDLGIDPANITNQVFVANVSYVCNGYYSPPKTEYISSLSK